MRERLDLYKVHLGRMQFMNIITSADSLRDPKDMDPKADIISLGMTDDFFVRTIARSLAYYATSVTWMSEEQFTAFIRFCNSSVSVPGVQYIFKPRFNLGTEMIEIGQFDEKQSTFLSDGQISNYRIPYEEGVIKLQCTVGDTRKREVVDITNDKSILVKVQIRFTIEFSLADRELHYMLTKIGFQASHLETDYSDVIAEEVNRIYEYYSDWDEDGHELNIRTRTNKNFWVL